MSPAQVLYCSVTSPSRGCKHSQKGGRSSTNRFSRPSAFVSKVGASTLMPHPYHIITPHCILQHKVSRTQCSEQPPLRPSRFHATLDLAGSPFTPPLLPGLAMAFRPRFEGRGRWLRPRAPPVHAPPSTVLSGSPHVALGHEPALVGPRRGGGLQQRDPPPRAFSPVSELDPRSRASSFQGG